MSGIDARTAPASTAPRRWSRFKYPQSLIRYGVLLAVLMFLTYSTDYLNIHWDRFLAMFGRVGDLMVNRYYPPDIPYVLDGRYLGYVLETIQMAFLGALFGLLISAPLAWFAAFNMTPSKRFVFPLARLAIMGCRSVHEMIWAILFVTILGFGVLPGVLALTLFSVGFAGKLLAEEVEAIDRGQVEAVRASGANEFQVMLYAVLPQVRVAWTGIAIYTWDVAFRAATVVGFFGAGGMGWYLKRNVQQLETERVAAILLSIIFLVIVAEVISAWARDRVAKN
ncbi:MAG: phosphonate ABC transporter, permease protein PhnE [Kiloniellales bacterium]|jgi:phosphonate transport system permease protein